MSLDEALVAFVRATPELRATVGDRVAFLALGTVDALPYVAIDLATTEPARSLSRHAPRSELASHRYTLTVYAATRAQARDISDRIAAHLERWRGAQGDMYTVQFPKVSNMRDAPAGPESGANAPIPGMAFDLECWARHRPTQAA